MYIEQEKTETPIYINEKQPLTNDRKRERERIEKTAEKILICVPIKSMLNCFSLSLSLSLILVLTRTAFVAF